MGPFRLPSEGVQLATLMLNTQVIGDHAHNETGGGVRKFSTRYETIGGYSS